METLHIVIVLIIIALLYSRYEGYTNFCSNCHDLTNKQCKDCPNCGICKTDSGNSKCLAGDDAGPYFSDECVDWKYMGKTPNKKCGNYNKASPLNCGYIFPYNKRTLLERKFASLQSQLGTLSS